MHARRVVHDVHLPRVRLGRHRDRGVALVRRCAAVDAQERVAARLERDDVPPEHLLNLGDVGALAVYALVAPADLDCGLSRKHRAPQIDRRDGLLHADNEHARCTQLVLPALTHSRLTLLLAKRKTQELARNPDGDADNQNLPG